MLVYRAPGYMLRVAPGDVDIGALRVACRRGQNRHARPMSPTASGRAPRLFSEALGLYRGPLLADVAQSPLIATNADRTAELWLTTTELRVEADLACGRAVQAVPELRGLVTEHPLRERLWALLMRALEASGRRAEALEIYAQARQVIADELGVDPGDCRASAALRRTARRRRVHAVGRHATQATTARRTPGNPRYGRRGGGACPSSAAGRQGGHGVDARSWR